MEETRKVPERTPDDEDEEVIGITEEDSNDGFEDISESDLDDSLDKIQDLLEAMPEIRQIVKDLLGRPNELQNNAVVALRGLLEPSPSSEQSSDGLDALFNYLQGQIVDWMNLPDWESSRLHLHAHPILLTDPVGLVLEMLIEMNPDQTHVAAYTEHLQLQRYAKKLGIDAAYEHFLKTHKGMHAINTELGELIEELKNLMSRDADLPRQIELCEQIIHLDGMIHTLIDLTRGTVHETLGDLLLQQAEQDGGAGAVGLIKQAISHFNVSLENFDQKIMAAQHARTQESKADALRLLSEWQEGVEAIRSLEQAIACSDIVLDIYDRRNMPQQHANAQQHKGVALALLATQRVGVESMQLLEQAMACFDIALEIFEHHNIPHGYAMTQDCRGGTLVRLAEGSGGAKAVKSLEQAITCFDIALGIYERDNMASYCSSAQMNKGGALVRLAERLGGSNASRLLKQATACFDAALEIDGRSSLISMHAGIQINKGNALRDLAEQYSGEDRMRLLEQAIACFDVVLEIDRHRSNPQERATAQMNKGTALHKIAEERTGTEAVELLEQAIACFDTAMTTFDQSMPHWHALTQMNKGNALQSLASEGTEAVSLLERAITCYDVALEINGSDSESPDYAAGQQNKGNVLLKLAELREGPEAIIAIEQAIACFDIALTIFDSGSSAPRYIATQLSKGNALQHLGEALGGQEAMELFEQAIACFDATLAVVDRDSMPSEYFKVQIIKGNAFEKLAERFTGLEAIELMEQAVTCFYDVIGMKVLDFDTKVFDGTDKKFYGGFTSDRQLEESGEAEAIGLPESSQLYPTVRLTQTSGRAHNYKVEIEFNGHTVTTLLFLEYSQQYQEDTRWYFEDYLRYSFDPAPTIAENVEKRMAVIGRHLFKYIFQSSEEARNLWSSLRPQLSEIRFEVRTESGKAIELPWELSQDPQSDTFLALQARAFVRTLSELAKHPSLPKPDSRPIRILLVISRPGGQEDVPFRSVANHLLKSFSGRDDLQLEVLRPSTFAQLTTSLRAAKASGRSYHIVHFDGHGIYEDVLARSSGQPPKRMRGYLEFENPESQGNVELIHGTLLGQELSNAGVSLLVVNACRSAYTKAGAEPQKPSTSDQSLSYGALAEEVISAGVPGVVAMQYNIHVSTAARFVADLYAGLLQGLSLGEAATLARRNLHSNPLREVNGVASKLEDWSVPLVFETAPIALFHKSNKDEAGKTIGGVQSSKIALTRQMLDANLPPTPVAGFTGRDETILALDRAFNVHSIVLLQATTGGGKTATATEFARWYTLTGGLNGPVLFSSIEQYKSFDQVLDTVSRVFASELEQLGVQWTTLDEQQQLVIALHLLRKNAVLWIWDNVDIIIDASGRESTAWSSSDLQRLTVFLWVARLFKSKFLLTSRQDQLAFVSAPMALVKILPMPMQERVQLARALVERQGQVWRTPDWLPLLDYTQGNPLIIVLVVNRALRERLQTQEQFQDLLIRLQAGDITLEDEVGELNLKSPSTASSHPISQAFNEDECKQLALLHLFHDFVNVDTLLFMGDSRLGNLADIRHMKRENWKALLNRATERGILTHHDEGYYLIHPASRSHLKNLFDLYYPAIDAKGNELAIQTTRAFVEAIGEMGDEYLFDYMNGDQTLVDVLEFEVPNLLRAWQLARTNKWWDALTSIMQGLRVLNDNPDHWTEWARLVEEITPEFIDESTGGPLPGCEEWWSLITGYRVEIAEKARQWSVVEQLLNKRVSWNRNLVSSIYTDPQDALSPEQQNLLRTLAVSLAQLGSLYDEQKKSGCIELYEEAIALFQRLGYPRDEAATAQNLATYYLHSVPSPSNLEQAEHWYRQCLQLFGEKDRTLRGASFFGLGRVEIARFNEMRKAKWPNKGDLLRSIKNGVQFLQRARTVLPPNNWKELSLVHRSLGLIYFVIGAADPAVAFMREAIRCADLAGDQNTSAEYREDISWMLAILNRPHDAHLYMEVVRHLNKEFGDQEMSDTLEEEGLI